MAKKVFKIEKDVEYTKHDCYGCGERIIVGHLSWCSHSSHMTGPIGPQPLCRRCKEGSAKTLKGVHHWENRKF